MNSVPLTIPLDRGLVLVADGFEEETTVGCLRGLRDRGMAVALVGLTAGLVTGSRGVTVRPDLSMDQVGLEDSTLIVLAGGRRCASALLADPRVHRLIEITAENGGQIGVLRAAESTAAQLLRKPFFSQSQETVNQFVDSLLQGKG